ncbi:hypothetical protein [Algoriphagus formosus]|uniref:hypothetical protein n=1 Tax=Algoriphagus formosus TaxID=2007308 RepID=UPI000C28B5C4|nr:hypothetical protein [Algoriphagus formosus]
MKKYEFHIRLLSDLVLTSSAATESHSSSLNYIPGSKFLGIVAKSLYKMDDEKSTLEIFHSGKVIFSDAHPIIEKKRFYPSPANYYFKKGEGLGNEIFLHHNLDKKTQKKLRTENIQLKQSRTGYIQPELKKYLAIKQNYRLKSAYDPTLRKSKDSQMFGYFSVPAHTEFVFTVEDQTGQYIEEIKKALIGKKQIGRSKSAEYGLVEIEFNGELKPIYQINLTGRTVIYAQSNLCFINNFGQTTALPEAEQLTGISESEIIWEQSQIRSRKYQSWNGTRNSKDADRIIIEKGSVFVVNLKRPIDSDFFEGGVGSYKSEGFGKVLVNPDFLPVEGVNLGFSFSSQKKAVSSFELYADVVDEAIDVVIKTLKNRENLHSFDQEVKSEVKGFLENHRHYFKMVSKSQWGTLRAYAKQCLTLQAFDALVFGNSDVKGLEGFVYKGSSQNQWKVGGDFLRKELKRIAENKGEKFALSFIQKLSSEIKTQ